MRVDDRQAAPLVGEHCCELLRLRNVGNEMGERGRRQLDVVRDGANPWIVFFAERL
jgi:hypothetical protein